MTDTRTIPANKTELLAYTEDRWRAFVARTDALSDAEWAGLIDAGGWSVKDHVAHVVSWVRAEIALLQYRTPLQLSQGISDTLWNAGDFDPINEEVRKATIGDSPATVREERDTVFQKLIEVYSAYSEDDLARPANVFGLNEDGKSLLTVLIEYHGEHFEQHREYVQGITAQG